MSMTDFDKKQMTIEMGICPECHDHMPCGCNNEWNEAYEDDPEPKKVPTGMWTNKETGTRLYGPNIYQP